MTKKRNGEKQSTTFFNYKLKRHFHKTRKGHFYLLADLLNSALHKSVLKVICHNVQVKAQEKEQAVETADIYIL